MQKLKENKILLLSGPPKSGKTFNAEMILLSKFSNEQFIPYKIETPEDFENLYDSKEKQIFLFDDAFGKHDIELYRADIFNRKLEFIFELIDSNHNCIFTSREYIFKAFSNYADVNVEKLINKINVEVSRLSRGERESLFLRYFGLAFPDYGVPNSSFLKEIVNHKNFSPETIRAYFDNAEVFSSSEFTAHLNLPEKYLEKLFNNLAEEKRIILLSILLSLKGNEPTISYAFNNISHDINRQFLIALKSELIQMEGSIIKSNSNKYDFYHPSMKDFFINFLSADIAIYRGLLFKNLNIDLLAISKFKPEKSKIKYLEISLIDVGHIKVGFERLIKNPHISLFELNSLFTWLNDIDVQLNLQLKLKSDYSDIMTIMYEAFSTLNYMVHKHESIAQLSDFFKNVRSFLAITKKETFFKSDFVNYLILNQKKDRDFWLLVFRIAPLVKEDVIYNSVGREWLNAFYLELKAEINSLGYELYGDEYPNFEKVAKYKALLAEKNYVEANKITKKSRADYMQKTNNHWYPRYKACRDKMNVMKSCPTFGYTIYQKLAENFGHLTILEDKQKNRYYFNIKNEWWVGISLTAKK